MDISKLSIPTTAVIHLEFPGIGKLFDDDSGEPVTITVYGPSSDQSVAYRRKLTREVAQSMAKKGARGAYGVDIEEREVERLCALTATVSNLSYKGEKITPDNIEKVYRDPSMGWIKDQVAEKLGDWESFLL